MTIAAPAVRKSHPVADEKAEDVPDEDSPVGEVAGDDPLVGLPGYVLRRASAATLGELNQRLEPLKLRHADVAFLMLIEALPGITQSEAGRILDIQRANMVPFVARLERRGFIARKRVDGRSLALRLTAAGRAVTAKARRVVDRFEAALVERVPARLRPFVLPILIALWNRNSSDGGHEFSA
jgi:DNA-binding MarR family transcriptional regulator